MTAWYQVILKTKFELKSQWLLVLHRINLKIVDNNNGKQI